MTDEETEFIVQYESEKYDIAKLIKKHPGGVNTLKGLQNAEVTKRFQKAPAHSPAAMYLLKEYKISEDSDNNNGLDDSMEHLVDWSKAMLPQISRITQHYDEWVHKPVDRPLRMFESDYLEVLTKSPWYVVPAFWIPGILYIMYLETANTRKPAIECVIGRFAAGVCLWTLLEYCIHRWIFHMNTTNRSSAICTVHFLLHGLHHKVPFDTNRLVFPPIPAVFFAAVLYYPIWSLFSHPRIILAGGLSGYVFYDMMHYYLHYGNPSSHHLHEMKRYHYQHHFPHQDQGFGISSPLWDFVFGTAIRLRKLNFKLKWR